MRPKGLTQGEIEKFGNSTDEESEEEEEDDNKSVQLVSNCAGKKPISVRRNDVANTRSL